MLCTMPIRPVTVYNIICYSDKHFLSSYQTKSASLLNGDADKLLTVGRPNLKTGMFESFSLKRNP